VCACVCDTHCIQACPFCAQFWWYHHWWVLSMV